MSPRPHRPSPSTATGRTRRQLLTSGGAALGASLSALTAGCLSGLPPLGESQQYGRLTVPPADDPAYRKWLPAPSSVDSPIERYHFAAVQPAVAPAGAPELFVARRAHAKADLDYFGIGFENYDRLVDSNVGTAIEAVFDRDRIRQTITDSGYEEAGQYRGYGLFARSDVPRRVAVGDEALVWTSAYQHDSPDLEAVVDAGEGERPRYHEESAAFERLTAAAGGNPYTIVNTEVHDPTGRPVTLADSIRFDDDAAYQIVHYQYEEGSPATEEALERALTDDRYRFADDADEFDVTTDGSLATVETRVPLKPDRTFGSEYEYPHVTWGVSSDGAAETVTFRHDAGDPVPGGRLFSDIDDPSRPGEIEPRPLWSDVGTVRPGDEATVDFSGRPNASDVTLVYLPRDARYHVLFGVDVGGETDD